MKNCTTFAQSSLSIVGKVNMKVSPGPAWPLSIALTIVLASAGEEACKCSYEKVRLVRTYLSQNAHKHTEKVIENLAAGFS